MRDWIIQLDRLLRGEATRVDVLRTGTIPVQARRLIAVVIILGIIYGVCMGMFSVFKEGPSNWMQVVATALKVPALFLLTLLVTLPSLYVFNALVGSRLNVVSVVRLLMAAVAVNLAVLASLGPIVAFFSASTTSYSFMVLLNVAVFSVSGFLGLLFLLQTLHRLTLSIMGTLSPAEPLPAGPSDVPPTIPPRTGALDRTEGHVLGPHVKTVFRIWMFVFGLVGAQMGWVLRPFLGDPSQPFTWFRPRASNFFEAVWQHFINLFR